MTFAIGDRVKVKPEYDELAKVLGPFGHPGTQPGTVLEVHGETIIVGEDGSTAAPYKEHELELIAQ